MNAQTVVGVLAAVSVGILASTAEGRSNAYVVNAGDDTVSVIDVERNTAVGPPIAVGQRPVAIAVAPNGTRAYVVNASDASVSVIDTTTNTVTPPPTSVGRPNLYGSGAIAVTPDGAHVYVALDNTDNIAVIDVATHTVLTLIPVGRLPRAIAMNPDGRHAYVTTGEGTVAIIDTASNSVSSPPIQINGAAEAIAVTPDGRRLYVTDDSDNQTVWVIDALTDAVAGAVGTGRFDLTPVSVAITPNGAHAYVGYLAEVEGYPDAVQVMDTAVSAFIEPAIHVGVGTGPSAIAIAPDGKRVYVADNGSDSVAVIDTTTNAVVGKPIIVGHGPFAIAIASTTTGQQSESSGCELTRERNGRIGTAGSGIVLLLGLVWRCRPKRNR